ncbi:MAG: hypothetical protein AAFQ91_34080, partial [Cyanobacteria bacterium J06621_15]
PPLSFTLTILVDQQYRIESEKFWPLRLWYSRREILVAKGFLNDNCPTFDDWTIIFKVSITTIWQ